MTKTKTITIAEVIASAEERTNADIAPVKATLADLTSALNEATTVVRDIEDGVGPVEDVRTRWVKGEDVPALDYVAAQASEAKAQHIAKVLPNRRDRLANTLPAEDKAIAEHVAPLFRVALPSVTVIATNAPIRTWQQDVPEETVAVVLVQSPRGSTDPLTGVRSGEVTAYYFRNPLYASVPVNALESAAKAQRIGLEVIVNNPAGASAWETVAGIDDKSDEDRAVMVCDRMVMRVSNVLDGLPVIRKVDTSGLHVRLWVDAFFAENGGGAVAYDTGHAGPRSWRVYAGMSRAHSVSAQTPEATETIEGNRRTYVVRVPLSTTGVLPYDFLDSIQRRAAEEVGTVTVGLGVLESSEVEYKTPPESRASVQQFEVVLTYGSTVPE